MYSSQNKKTNTLTINKNSFSCSENEQNVPLHPEILFKQVYICSCGKQYQSFSAIYLHFRQKHDIKLSTRPTERRKKVQIEGNLKKIIYLIECQDNEQSELQNSNEKQQNSPPKTMNFDYLEPVVQNIRSSITKYLKILNDGQEKLIANFMRFLNNEVTSGKPSQKEIKIKNIPYFLNDFALSYLPNIEDGQAVGSESWRQSCLNLKKFCDWLKENELTDLIVQYDKE